MKNKIKTIITSAFVLAFSNLFTSFAFAESTTKDSIGSVDMEDNGTTIGVDETQIQKTEYSNEIITDSEENTKVYVSQASSFGVYIPKVLTLDGKKNDANENKANYIVRLSEYSNFAGKEKVLVVPEEEFTLSQLGKDDIYATIEQDKQEWLHNEVDVVGNGEVIATNMSAGSWKGIFYFNIELKDTSVIDYTNVDFNDLTWDQIATLSDSNEFLNYYEVGATKTFEYEGRTYQAEVIGVNTYNNGELTFMTKELLPDKYPMNATETNEGGWVASDLRQTLNSTIYNGLPEDLKNVITPKTLTYVVKNKTLEDQILLEEATDNLWLPTLYEIGGTHLENSNESNLANSMIKLKNAINGKQKVYDKFSEVTNWWTADKNLILKNEYAGTTCWWLATSMETDAFHQVKSSLEFMGNSADMEAGVPLCFVI